MLEYAPVLRIVHRGIYKNKIVWLQDFRAIPWRKILDIVRNFAKSCQHTIFWLFAYGAVLTRFFTDCFLNYTDFARATSHKLKPSTHPTLQFWYQNLLFLIFSWDNIRLWIGSWKKCTKKFLFLFCFVFVFVFLLFVWLFVVVVVGFFFLVVLFCFCFQLNFCFVCLLVFFCFCCCCCCLLVLCFACFCFCFWFFFCLFFVCLIFNGACVVRL